MRTSAKKLTVMHLIPAIPRGGGAEHLLLDICRSVDKGRYSIIVAFWGERDDLRADMEAAGASVIRLRWNRVLSWGALRSLIGVLKEKRVDVLHTHFMDSDLLGAWAALAAGIPMIAHVHSYPFPQNGRQAWRYRMMSPLMKRIIAVSDHVKRFVMAKSGIGNDKCVVVPNGVDVARFRANVPSEKKDALKRAWGIAPGDIVVGTVTRFEADKSVDTLLRGVPLILKQCPLARIVIVGHGLLEDRLKALSQELGIAAHVVFAGRQDDIPLCLSVMDVFVMTAVEEAFGLSLLEAMAAGRPVAAANAAALPDLVADGVQGLLFTPGDEKALAKAVTRMIEDRPAAGQMALAGMRRADELTSQAMVKRLEGLYAEVADHG
jgi:glycosyltransferase involved in cell wall biosynthesis